MARRHERKSRLAFRGCSGSTCHRDYWRSAPHAEEWFLVEWPEGESQPTKYWLSTLPPDTTISALVEHAKLRWRIERDYQESNKNSGSIITKDEVGAAFTTTWPSVSRPTDSWSPRGVRFPLRRQNHDPQSALLIQRLSTPRIRPSDPNATSSHQSRASALGWRASWCDGCSDVRVANEKSSGKICDTVKLPAC